MAVTLGGIALPDDIVWLDELAWSPVVQATSRTLSGAIVIEEATLQEGRPITLGGGVWVPRSDVEALLSLAATAGATHSLDLRGTAFDVVFRRPNAITATPVIQYADPAPEDPHEITIQLLTVQL